MYLFLNQNGKFIIFYYVVYIPPCFVVDLQGNLHHTFGEVMPFMRISGKATLNILKIVKKELSISLGIAIRRAAKEKRSILYKEVHLRGINIYSILHILTPFQNWIHSCMCVCSHFHLPIVSRSSSLFSLRNLSNKFTLSRPPMPLITRSSC